jgi:hypothetical protein
VMEMELFEAAVTFPYFIWEEYLEIFDKYGSSSVDKTEKEVLCVCVCVCVFGQRRENPFECEWDSNLLWLV